MEAFMEQNQKTIRVMGTGFVKIAPDTTRLTFSIDSKYDSYEKAYNEASLGNNGLRDALKKLNIPKESLKTSDFSISKHREWISKEVRWLVEYHLNQSLSIELPLDSVLTSKVMSTLGAAWPELEVNISFIRKDSHGAKLQILESAVKDAREKAGVIAMTLGHKLGGIVSVDYSKRSIDIEFHSDAELCEEKCYGASPVEYTPDDIEAGDTVETVWYLD